jgi:CheY-like chemotaxis protein
MNATADLKQTRGRKFGLPLRETSSAADTFKCVLLADDDDMVRAALAAVLESEGYRVAEAKDGLEAVRQAARHRPDLLLLDLNMPHVDGWNAFAQIDGFSPLLPVIVITGRPRQYEEAARLGVDAFMEKPLDMPVLLDAIKTLINEPEARRVKRITDHNFVTQLLNSGRILHEVPNPIEKYRH